MSPIEMSPLPFLVDAARGTVLLGLALAVMPLLRRAPASTRRLVLVLGLAAAALVPVASRLVPAWRVLPVAELGVADASRPFAEPIGDAIAPPSVEPVSHAVAQAPSTPVAPAKQSFPWGPVLLAVWALGAFAVLARLAHGLAKARGIARRATPLSLPGITATLGEARMNARVCVSSEIDVPAVTGVFSAVVLVPREAIEWSPARWRAVLLHELAHVRQRDCLAQIVGQLACAMHWFNPLVWLAARRLRMERELSADERVLESGARPTEYAEHLLAIATSAARLREVPGGALGMAEPSQLLARVEAIVRPRAGSLRTSAARGVAITASAAALLGVMACVTAGKEGPAAAVTANPANPSGKSEPVAPAPAGASVPTSTSAAASSTPVSLAHLTAEIASVLGAPADRLELTIDRDIQAIVDEEMKRMADEWRPVAATAIVLDPRTGEVLAIHDPSTAAAPRISGSTIKSLTVAAALDEGAIAVTDRFFCDKGARSYGKEILRDASPNEWLDVPQILARSSNIGASRIFDKLGGEALGRWLRRFHFGEAMRIQLRGAPVGEVPPVIADGSLRGVALASGHGGAMASPLQMAAAYAAIANDGVFNAPTLARRARGADGSVRFEHHVENERVLRPETARAVMGMLERAVSDEQATGKAARVQGVRVAGKTGTTDEQSAAGEPRNYASFIGVAPAEQPRFVILVGAVVAAEDATGGKVAGPVFARITARALGR
ncbi:penicillin-binding transpeptidase domain-containing protein [Sorangium sp. So ce302]|uniref:penicillin-binding transpeptidase domain-containing protein n=1 Tax=Sorangium sp. So ce302 TaxID=3133297 RepID=UPI003F635B0A